MKIIVYIKICIILQNKIEGFLCKYILRKMMTEKSQKIPKNPNEYICEQCEYITLSKKDFNKHLLTRKHKILTDTYTDTYKKLPKNASLYKCVCGKEYKHRQSLNNHKQKCTYQPEPELEPEPESESESEPEPEPVSKEPEPSVTENKVFMDTMVQFMQSQTKTNEKLYEKLEEVTTENKVVNNYTTNNFNLNMFLNDTCKNAMNISDFIESIKLSISDMDYLGKAGYVEGVSRAIIDNLNQLDVTERPIHCTDAKRNSLYLRNNDEWNKESVDMPNMKKVIKNVTQKNQSTLFEWMGKNPGHKNPMSQKHKDYMTIVDAAMGPGTDEEESTSYKSIINKVSSATTIDKQTGPTKPPG